MVGIAQWYALMTLIPLTENTRTEKSEVQRLTYTLAETCSAIGISPTTIWRLERRGLLLPIQGLRHKRFSVNAVRRFVEGGK